MELKSFFSIGDGMMYPVADLDSFKRSLLMNVLFHDRVVFDGTYFFNSQIVKDYIRDHKKSGKTKISLLNFFAKKGIVVPAIREDKIMTMEELHGYYTSELYPNPNVFSKTIDPNLFDLHGSLNKGMEKKNPIYLKAPKNGENDNAYYDLVKALFKKNKEEILQEVAGIDKKWFSNIWEISSPWRNEVLDIAREQTLNKGVGVSLQRSEFLKVLGKKILNHPKRGSSLSYIEEMKERLGQQEGYALDFVMASINHYHHIDLAQKYTNSMDFPMYNLASPIVANNQKSISIERKVKKVSFQLKLPSFNSLLKIEPEELYKVRKNHLKKYREALIAYSNDSNLDSKIKVRESLKDYFRDLTVASNSKQLPLKAVVKSDKDILKESILNTIKSGVEGAIVDYGKYVINGTEDSFSYYSTIGLIGVGMVFGFARNHYLKSNLLSQPFKFEATLPVNN